MFICDVPSLPPMNKASLPLLPSFPPSLPHLAFPWQGGATKFLRDNARADADVTPILNMKGRERDRGRGTSPGCPIQ